MVIHGREIGFRRSVMATCEIADLAPDGDINRYDELLTSKQYSISQRASANIILALNKAYEMTLKYEDPSHTPNPLSMEEVLLLSDEEFAALFQEAISAWANDGKVTVEAEAPKSKKGNADGDGE